MDDGFRKGKGNKREIKDDIFQGKLDGSEFGFFQKILIENLKGRMCDGV